MFYLSKKQDIFRLKPHLLHLKQKFVFDWNTPTGEASAETPGMGGGGWTTSTSLRGWMQNYHHGRVQQE